MHFVAHSVMQSDLERMTKSGVFWTTGLQYASLMVFFPTHDQSTPRILLLSYSNPPVPTRRTNVSEHSLHCSVGWLKGLSVRSVTRHNLLNITANCHLTARLCCTHVAAIQLTSRTLRCAMVKRGQPFLSCMPRACVVR